VRRQTERITAIVACAIAALSPCSFAQDDWHVVERHLTTRETPSPRPENAQPAGTFLACGEDAREAGLPYQTIVQQINEAAGSDVRVYESIRRVGPHASTGGCIFYNRAFLAALLQRWMNVQDADAAQPMLYAIFAHEVGHQVHGDTNPGTKPARERELAADRFAGFTLERLGIRRLDPTEVTQYYQLTGDDFTGGDGTHGSGADRAAAFENGWHRAEMGLREEDDQPAGGLGEP
jgi:hypothetical protein